MTKKMVFAGFGGQGVLTLGLIVAEIAMDKGLNVSWIPSYGAEMRGGTANCSVIISDNEISNPIIANGITNLVTMNKPSLDKFQSKVAKDGVIILNSSIIKEYDKNGYETIEINATDIASKVGNLKVQNMVMLGAIAKQTGLFDINDIEKTFKKKFTGNKANLIDKNLLAVKEGMESL